MRIRLFALGSLSMFLAWPWLTADLAILLDGRAGFTVQFLISKLLLCLSLCGLASVFGVWKQIGFRGPRGVRGWLSSLPLWAFILVMIASGGVFGAPGLNTMILVFIPLALATSLSEEIVFRGSVWTALGPLGRWPVVLLTSVAFGAVHLQGLTTDIPDVMIHAQAFMAFAIGLVFAAMRLASGSIWPPIAAHALFNWLSFSINGFGESAGPMPEGISPEQIATGLVIISLVIAVSGLAACWLAIRAEARRNLPPSGVANPAVA